LTAGAIAQNVPRAEMEHVIIAGMYRQACEEAKAQGHTNSVDGCAANLVKTRGPAFAEKLRLYPDHRVHALYMQYRPKS
jgi:hypothetical protein